MLIRLNFIDLSELSSKLLVAARNTVVAKFLAEPSDIGPYGANPE
jgi:hypothetical protein